MIYHYKTHNLQLSH